MFRQLVVPIFGVVENMSYFELPDGSKMDIFGSGGGESIAESTGVPFMGLIPMDATVRVGGDAGLPVVVSRPESDVVKALVKISQDVAVKISIAALQQKSDIPISLV